MHLQFYLNTEEAAAYLKISERKLYELVATGAVPCSKLTGKWLFPRAALDRWVEAGLTRPEGFQSEAPPAIIGGSHDPLLEWAVRRSGSGLALLAEGSQAGLDRLARNEVMLAAIHLHGQGDKNGDDTGANIEAVAAASALHDAVVISFAIREQGLVLANGNPLGIGSLAEALTGPVRFGQRQKGAGAQLLLESLAMLDGLDEALRQLPATIFPTGQDLALAIRNGEIDCGIAARAVALASGLAYVPLVSERFDLVLRRRSYFEPGPQALFALLRRPEFVRQAASFGGYDVAGAGMVRLNR
jgi:putative molybdopterin biosynthesis protein